MQKVISCFWDGLEYIWLQSIFQFCNSCLRNNTRWLSFRFTVFSHLTARLCLLRKKAVLYDNYLDSSNQDKMSSLNEKSTYMWIYFLILAVPPHILTISMTENHIQIHRYIPHHSINTLIYGAWEFFINIKC